MYESVIRNRVAKALDEKELEFEEAYKSASDKELLDYLRSCAIMLKHSPWSREIIGGRYIKNRFKTWTEALKKAGLPAPKTPDEPKNFLIVMEETENQKILYRRRKAEKTKRSLVKRETESIKANPGEPYITP